MPERPVRLLLNLKPEVDRKERKETQRGTPSSVGLELHKDLV